MLNHQLGRIGLRFLLLLALTLASNTASSLTYPTGYTPGVVSSCKTRIPKKFFGLCSNTGPIFFGATAHQSFQPGVTIGYNIGLGGAAFFYETDIYGILKLGAAISGYRMQITPGADTTGLTPRTVVYSGTPAVYGGLSYAGAFFFLTGSTGILKYSTRRTVTIINQVAVANFEARQNSFRARVGYAAPLGTLEITPMAVVDTVNLRKGSYIETGAGAFNLTVINGETSGSQLAFGARFAEISEPEIFYPEVHVFTFSDSKNIRLRVISRFLDGIPPIPLEGVTPQLSGFNVGGSIATTIFGQGMYVIASYDYETRQRKFSSHSFFLKILANF